MTNVTNPSPLSVNVETGAAATPAKEINGFKLVGHTATKVIDMPDRKKLTVTVKFPEKTKEADIEKRLNNFDRKIEACAKFATSLGIGDPDKDVRAVKFLEDANGKVSTQQLLKSESKFKPINEKYFTAKEKEISGSPNLSDEQKKALKEKLKEQKDLIGNINTVWKGVNPASENERKKDETPETPKLDAKETHKTEKKSLKEKFEEHVTTPIRKTFEKPPTNLPGEEPNNAGVPLQDNESQIRKLKDEKRSSSEDI